MRSSKRTETTTGKVLWRARRSSVLLIPVWKYIKQVLSFFSVASWDIWVTTLEMTCMNLHPA